MSRPTLATIWLDGCSGCHMSFLDLDERLLELAERADLVFSPLVDLKEYPERVDIALVEGAVATEEDLAKIRMVRGRTRLLVSFGDCAVTGNVAAMRNPFGVDGVAERAYREHTEPPAALPADPILPVLLERACPVHEKVSVDLVLPGCPPSADLIWHAITELLEGRTPDLATEARFG